MRRLIFGFVAFALLLVGNLASAAPQTYFVNRTVGAGVLTGFIETDGTLGVLVGENITDWSVTMSSPNLSGSPTTISIADSSVTSFVGGVTTATPTELLFDFGIAGAGYMFLIGGSPQHYWCLEVNTNCTGAGTGEHFGLNGNLPIPAESAMRSGLVAFASVTAVPEPETYAMLFTGIGLIWLKVRRKKRRVLVMT